jgi:hypothetical protein
MALPLDEEEEKRKKAQQAPIVEKVGTATRVGDTLYGSRTGITPDNLSKAQNYLNTQSTLDRTIRDPKATLPQMMEATAANDAAMESAVNAGVTDASISALRGQEMREVAPGVKMGVDTAQRYLSNLEERNKMEAQSRPNYALAQESLKRIARERDEKAKTDFDAGVKKWNETLQAREDEKVIQEMAKMEQRAAGRAYSDANAARRFAKDARNPVAASEEANRDMYAAETRLGPSNNTEVRNRRFYENAKDRFLKNRANPYQDSSPSPAATPASSFGMGIPATAPSFSLDSSDPISMSLSPTSGVARVLTPEEERQAKARQRLSSELRLANI